MLFPSWIVDEIAKSAYWADRTIRAALARGLIAGENDYSSNLTSEFRRQINARAIPVLRATSYLLKPSEERKFGADGCIILSNTSEFKVCVFEAKWPRLNSPRDYWDSPQRSSGVSHFHEQLVKQSKVSPPFAVWEMFYCESPFGKQPAFIPYDVSSCVWHEHAFAVSQSRANYRRRWTNTELSNLLNAYGSQIDALIREVCACYKGIPFHGQNYLSAFDNFGIPSEWLLIEYTASPVSDTS